MNPNNRLALPILLFAVLLGMSFFKDHFTPDHYNTGAAAFLKDHSSRPATLASHPGFWLISFLYSLVFVIFPALIVHSYFGNRQLTRFTWLVLAGVCLLLYLLVFINSAIIDRAIVPKVNRYFHSPIAILFFIAAFKLSKRIE